MLAADPRWAKTFFQPTELAFAGLEFIVLSLVCMLLALTARRQHAPPELGAVPKDVVNKDHVRPLLYPVSNPPLLSQRRRVNRSHPPSLFLALSLSRHAGR